MDITDGVRSSTANASSLLPRNPLATDTTHQWANVKPRRDAQKWYIHRVPTNLKVAGDERFKPVIISIGPYHCERTNSKQKDAMNVMHEHARELKVSEDHKKQYLHDLISHGTSDDSMPNMTLTEMVTRIKFMEQSIRGCYSETIDLDGDDLVKMMILDGCFILELLYKYMKKELGELPGRDKDDIFSNNWVLPSLRRDMMLLENQIPFFVLEALFEIAQRPPNPKIPTNFALHQLISNFFQAILPETDNKMIISTIGGKHILDILRTHLLCETEASHHLVDMPKIRYWEHTARATDLRKVGVVFMKEESNQGLLNVRFKGKNFKIPSFYIGRYWSILLANMIALEQCRRDYQDRITSYIFLLDNLIDTASDVRVLRDCEIIKGSNEEDETIALIVNGLCKQAVYTRFYYEDVFRDVNLYRKKWYRPWRASLIQNFFNIPWKGFSILAALFLLALSLTQTIHDFF